MLIYRHFMETGNAPSMAQVAAALHLKSAEIEGAWLELADARVTTFTPGTRSIWMAHPFSAEPTPYRVKSGRKSYWANCAWDALGIAAMLGRDTQCVGRCPDCDRNISLSVKKQAVSKTGVIHFVVPPRQFWQNIAFT